MREQIPPLGYVGLGLMGGKMAGRLLHQGARLTVWNRTADKMGPAIAAGAQAGRSPADVARRSEVVHLCLTGTEAVESVVFGKDGIAAGASAEKILVDHSTISPRATREMADRLRTSTGMAWVDAPVTGGTMGAENGTLVILAGGDIRDVDRLRPAMTHVSRRFAHMGSVGAGQATKLVNQVAVSCIYVVMAEMVTLARRGGVAADRLPDALEGGFGDSRLLQVMGPRMIAGDFRPIGQVKTMLKDLRLLAEFADATGTALPLTNLATQLYRLHEARGHGELDITSIVTLLDSSQLRGSTRGT